MARIAHFIDTSDTGGAEQVAVDLCARLPLVGHATELHHFGNGWIEEQCRKRNVSSVVLPREPWYRSKWSVGGFALRYARELRRRGIDLLHSHLYGPISAGAAAALVAGLPHVGTLHDVYLVQEQPARINLLRLTSTLGTQLIAVSEDMRRFYQRLGGGALTVDRIYNGVDVDGFPEAPERGGGLFTFVAVGRLAAIKGYDLLLEALARTGAAGPRLRIVGDGPQRAALTAQAARLGIGPRVEFIGFSSVVAELLGKADAFVLASRSEGLACSIMEAMAAALPCVVTDVGGNRELVIDGETGYVVPPEDVEALAARLQALAADRDLSRRLGAAARARAASHFSMQATLHHYDEIYRALLPCPGRDAAPDVG